MSLDVYLYRTEKHACSKCGHEDLVNARVCLYEANVTHNLARMASEAGIYEALWRPDEMTPPARLARDIIEPLRAGLALMKAEPDRFRAFNPENGWGSYGRFVPWIERYLEACEADPDAAIEVSR